MTIAPERIVQVGANFRLSPVGANVRLSLVEASVRDFSVVPNYRVVQVPEGE